MEMVLHVFDFIGRLHPLLVHLPIGILLLACIYYLIANEEQKQSQCRLIHFSLLWGMISAVGACVSGFILSRSGDYKGGLISLHQWMGIGVAVVSVACYIIHKKQWTFIKWGMLFLVVLIMIAGHLGGSITHGEGYLTAAFASNAESDKTPPKPIANIQEAQVYTDIIQPILSSKCYSCHGTDKQKGKLRLDQPEFILKGGKGGSAVVWSDAENSTMIKRILLPETDEDHMPPKEKPQLTKSEADLLQWWVTAGAEFHKKVNQVQVSDKIQPALMALQSGQVKEDAKLSITPEKEVGAGDEKAIAQLKEKGVMVAPVAANSNYLSVNFVASDPITAKELQQLQFLKKQLIWLKITDRNLKNADLATIGELTALMRLHIDGNPVTDAGIAHLKKLQELQYINLSGTRVSQKGLQQLSGLKNLEKIFLYRVPGAGFDLAAIKKTMPQVTIDTGGYKVPTFETDTTVLSRGNGDE